MANTIGTAYVRIMPTATGVQGQISKVLGPGAEAAGASAGKLSGGALVKSMAGVLAAAGAGKLISNSLFAGADLQQSMGGIETLYKGASDKMMKYANQAYMTSGVSANEYMQQVTSYSAGLISSMGGDVDAAADVANMAMIDMADNANKMGTPIENIQNAYQGFAKQNYTMLDNLKLGYGGTKTEMERLLKDATKISGVEYNIDNLSDVYEAIHVIQGEIGITGTTQEEAAQTISGSIGMMKAAYQDFLGNLALGNDIYPNMVALFSSVVTVAKNVIPAIGNILIGIPRMIIEHWPEIKTAITTAITNAINTIKNNGPTYLQAAADTVTKFANGIINNIPGLLTKIGEVIKKAVQYIGQAAPTIVKAAANILVSVGSTLIKNLPGIIKGVIKLGVTTIKSSFSLIRTALRSAVSGLGTIITAPFSGAWSKIKGIIDKVRGFFPVTLGKIFDGLKLPHISVSGGKAPFGIGGKGKLPSFNVEWYAKAEDNPFMFRGATLFGAGERNDEILYGRAALMRDIRQATNGGGQVTINVYPPAGSDPETIARLVEQRLITSTKRRNAAWA